MLFVAAVAATAAAAVAIYCEYCCSSSALLPGAFYPTLLRVGWCGVWFEYAGYCFYFALPPLLSCSTTDAVLREYAGYITFTLSYRLSYLALARTLLNSSSGALSWHIHGVGGCDRFLAMAFSRIKVKVATMINIEQRYGVFGNIWLRESLPKILYVLLKHPYRLS